MHVMCNHNVAMATNRVHASRARDVLIHRVILQLASYFTIIWRWSQIMIVISDVIVYFYVMFKTELD